MSVNVKKFTILDLNKDYNLNVKDSYIYQLSYGIVNLDNCTILKKKFFNDKKLSNYKKKLNQSLKNFYNYIKKSRLIELRHIEFFIQRNDKLPFFNKIFFLIEILEYLKNDKYKIEIITDDEFFFRTYQSIKRKNIKITYLRKKKKYISFFDYFKKTLIFNIKAFILVCFSKLINDNEKINKDFDNACLSIYPNFYKNKRHIFYKKRFLNLNFQITDETHLGYSLIKSLKNTILIKNLKDTVSAESHVQLITIFKNFFISLKNFKLICKSNDYKFRIDQLDVSDQLNKLFYDALINSNKLNIYDEALKKIFTNLNLKEFHYYLFEYSFGHYLCKLIKNYKPKTILVGYQHGLYSERLFWQNFSKVENYDIFFPDKVVFKYVYSKTAYKKYFSKSKLSITKDNSYKNKSFIKKIDHKFEVYLGLHDCYHLLNTIRMNDKKNIFNINIHPKTKFKNRINLNKNMLINVERPKKFNKIKLVSSGSTIVYQLYKKETFYILVGHNDVPQTPAIFDKLIFKFNT